MNDKLLVETAVLAGEIMLVSGAEIYRVEDTINHILRKANRQISEAIVLSTGIFVTLNDPELEPITVIRRVSDRSTNLNKVYLVNNVSRQLCSGTMTVEAAYEELQSVRTVQQYRPWLKNIGVVCVSLFLPCFWVAGAWNVWQPHLPEACLRESSGYRKNQTECVLPDFVRRICHSCSSTYDETMAIFGLEPRYCYNWLYYAFGSGGDLYDSNPRYIKWGLRCGVSQNHGSCSRRPGCGGRSRHGNRLI